MTAIQISDFDSDGVTLTPATHPDFDARAQAILAGNASPVLELKPYLAIVQNRNPRTVVAYTVSWQATLRNESTEVKHAQFKFPDAVAGTGNGLSVLQGREIMTGGERLVGMGFEVWPPEYVESYSEFGRQTANLLGEVKNLRIELDAVIFEDGAMLGRDESRLGEHFIEFVLAKQLLYRDIVVGLENGDVTEDVLARLRAMVAARPNLSHADPFAIYPRLAAEEVLRFHNRVVLEVFRRTLRRQPFVIKRLSETSD